MKSHLISGIVLFLGGILSAVAARQLVPPTRMGIAIIAVPALVLTSVGLLRFGFYLLERMQQPRWSQAGVRARRWRRRGSVLVARAEHLVAHAYGGGEVDDG